MTCLLGGPRQSEGKSRAAPGLGLHFDASVVAFQNASADRQTETDSTARLFRRKKGFKETRQNVSRNAGTIIAHDYLYRVVPFVGVAGDPKIATLGHGVHGIHHQCQQYLLDLRSIA